MTSLLNSTPISVNTTEDKDEVMMVPATYVVEKSRLKCKDKNRTKSNTQSDTDDINEIFTCKGDKCQTERDTHGLHLENFQERQDIKKNDHLLACQLQFAASQKELNNITNGLLETRNKAMTTRRQLARTERVHSRGISYIG